MQANDVPIVSPVTVVLVRSSLVVTASTRGTRPPIPKSMHDFLSFSFANSVSNTARVETRLDGIWYVTWTSK